MLKYLFLLLFNINCACADPMGFVFISLVQPMVAPEFKAHVNNFIEASNGTVSTYQLFNLYIQFIDINKNKTTSNMGIIGYCLVGQKRISIDRDWWFDPTTSNIDREALIFHEMGHCINFRDHVPHMEDQKTPFKSIGSLIFTPTPRGSEIPFPDHCPRSLMNAFIPPTNCLIVHKEEYRKELFQ